MTLSAADRRRMRRGLIGLVAVGLVAALVASASRLAVGAGTYTAVLPHTGGLRVGEEVQVAGVGVGEIRAIELGDDRVRVEFTVDDDIELGGRTRAEVKVATLLGTHFLLVSPRGDGELEDATIPASRTRVPYDLQDVIEDSAGELGTFDGEGIDRALQTLAQTLDRGDEELGPALDGVRRLSTLLARRSDDLGELLQAARTVTRQLSQGSKDIVTLMEQATLILDTLRSRRETIHTLLENLDQLATTLSDVVTENREDLARVLDQLQTVGQLLRRHESQLDQVARTLAPTARYFANAGGAGRWLSLYLPGAVPDNLGCRQEGRCS